MHSFVYIWYDRKHRRFYVGSHGGSPNDGYVCSSSWMKASHKRRPQDFKRRILASFNTREEAFDEERRWLLFIKPEELGKRYYNKTRTAYGSYVWQLEKTPEWKSNISKARKGKPLTEANRLALRKPKSYVPPFSPERKLAMSLARKGKSGKIPNESTRQKMSEALKGNTHTKGMRWITDGQTTKMSIEIPEGWKLGRNGWKVK